MKIFFVILTFFLTFTMQAQAVCTVSVTVDDAITVSTLDYLQRAQKKAKEQNCSSIFLRLNTPGGSLQSTRLIVEDILASEIPYLCLVTPRGGRAGSAGAIILQACHVNGALPTTNLGAATPILGNGETISSDLRKKLINDTVSWLETVTLLRGRNLKFSKDIIIEAKSFSSEEAFKMKALDILASDEAEFLKNSEGRIVTLGENKKVPVKVGELTEFIPDLRYKILTFIADPEFAYLLFMGSLALLYVEITHPGLIAPGVIGGIGLLLSMVAFHKLNVMWGGLALILLGLIFLVLELFVPSFGALGIGGMVSVFVGSLFLFDAQSTGYALPISIILPVVGVIGTLFLGLGYLAVRTVRLKTHDVDYDLLHAEGVVNQVDAQGRNGQIVILGETWRFTSEDILQINEGVRVISRQGLTLTVKKIK
ncbi:MAG: NfeD family protein [Bdellovibrio sp.]